MIVRNSTMLYYILYVKLILAYWNLENIKKGIEESEEDLIVELPNEDFPKRPTSPAVVPKRIRKQVEIFHGNPSLWWVGQFIRFLWKPNKEMRRKIEKIEIKHPIVGLVAFVEVCIWKGYIWTYVVYLFCRILFKMFLIFFYQKFITVWQNSK